MNKKIIIILAIILLAIIIVFVGLSNSTQTPPGNSGKNILSVTPQPNSQGSNSAQITSQDPQDIVPGLYPNPINNVATQEGFKITSAMVENNTDTSGNPVSDHLQLTLQNTTAADLSNFEVYYTITDPSTNKKEGYYKKLTNYVLKAGATQIIHFDNKQGNGHFTVNTHSLYFTSTNKLQFTIMVSTPGYKVETANIAKAAGGAETKD